MTNIVTISELYDLGGYDETKPNNNVLEYCIAESTETGWVLKTYTGAGELISERPADIVETLEITK